jgi:hypothetical protein
MSNGVYEAGTSNPIVERKDYQSIAAKFPGIRPHLVDQVTLIVDARLRFDNS